VAFESRIKAGEFVGLVTKLKIVIISIEIFLIVSFIHAQSIFNIVIVCKLVREFELCCRCCDVLRQKLFLTSLSQSFAQPNLSSAHDTCPSKVCDQLLATTKAQDLLHL
jgi:hypothetical protein